MITIGQRDTPRYKRNVPTYSHSRQHSMAPSHTTLVFCIHLSFISILFIFTSLLYLLYAKVYFYTREKSISFPICPGGRHLRHRWGQALPSPTGSGTSVTNGVKHLPSPTSSPHKKFHGSAPCRHMELSYYSILISIYSIPSLMISWSLSTFSITVP